MGLHWPDWATLSGQPRQSPSSGTYVPDEGGQLGIREGGPLLLVYPPVSSKVKRPPTLTVTLLLPPRPRPGSHDFRGASLLRRRKFQRRAPKYCSSNENPNPHI